MIVTVCAVVYVPVLGEMIGVAAVGWPLGFDTYVQFRMSCTAVKWPVPAVKPAYAVFPPTVLGISIDHDVVNVWVGFTVSVIVIVRVAPS